MAAKGGPFSFSIKQSHLHLIDIEYIGHMPETVVEHLERTESLVREAPEAVGLCYSVDQFTSFDRGQVMRHAMMFKRLGARVLGIAVVRPRAVVQFGATTVGLVSSTPLKTFDRREEALAWLQVLRKTGVG